MKKNKVLIISAFCLLALIVAFFSTHFFIDGNIYSIFSRSIDLSDSNAENTRALNRCIVLRRLDISNAGLTSTDDLINLTSLEYLDISDNKLEFSEIADLCSALPDCEIIYNAAIGNTFIERDTEFITLDDVSAQDCTSLLLIDQLQYADITACTEITDSILATAENDSCHFLWKMTMCGQEIFSDASTLTLISPTADDIIKLRLFRNLESVTIADCADYTVLLEVAPMLENCDVTWTVDMYGVAVSNKETRADISSHTVTDLDEFSEKLSYLPNLEYIDMCKCGLSNEQMEVLMERHPDIKFVWEITFGNGNVKWTVRTDITCFSSLGYIRCNDEQIAPLLKYCTDLVALDLGHHDITDLTPFSRLTKLKVLILGDNLFSDLTPLENLQELQYLELFLCNIKDVSPLAKLPNLIDLCIGGNPIQDITPFLSMKQLQRLWIARCGLSTEDRDRLREALPNCTFKFTVIDNLCEDWRMTDRNVAIRKAFGNWRYVVEFRNWDDVVYMEGVVLKEPVPQTLR